MQGKLIDVEVSPTINKEEIEQDKIKYNGEVVVNFIFANEADTVNSKVSKIPFEFSIDNPMQNENINVDTNVSVINKNFIQKDNGDIDCNIEMNASAEISQNSMINIIDNIDVQENDADSGDYDSLIIYIVQKGDTLWKIAKKFKSTVEDIARANGIEDSSKIDIGQKLYIPKFKYTRKSSIDAKSA